MKGISLLHKSLLLGLSVFLTTQPLNAAIYNFTNTTVDGNAQIDVASITTTNYTNYTSGSPTGSATNTAYFTSADHTGFGNLNVANTSGSGTFTTMYRLNTNQSVERGFNSSQTVALNSSPNAIYDQANGVGIPSTRPWDVAIVQIDGQYYFEFMLDVNENDNNISIDQIMVFTTDGSSNVTFPNSRSATPNGVEVMSYFNNNVAANLVYSLDEFNSSGTVTTDNSLLVLQAGSGSGKPDFAIYISVDSVVSGANAIDPETGRIYLWTEMGGVGTLGSINFGNSGGFEEWAYLKGASVYSDVLPEPQTYVSAFLLVCLAGYSAWKKRRQQISTAALDS